MISKNNITRCAKTIKQLIKRCESYGEFDKEGNLHLPTEKTETSYDINKSRINYESIKDGLSNIRNYTIKQEDKNVVLISN